MDERRAHERFACDLHVRVILPGGEELTGQAMDISFAGICVHIDEPVSARTLVEFRVWAVLPEGETEEIAVPGKVVWSTPVEGRHQLGGTFDRDMDNRACTRLDTLLQLLGAPAS